MEANTAPVGEKGINYLEFEEQIDKTLLPFFAKSVMAAAGYGNIC